ncbi:hypothetical protein N566_12085 [Streptomycetaceae bacterium MP113-05]|nr:hypothetical protein N566_12085 [Streptomycetaceae bacterium MP113-05]
MVDGGGKLLGDSPLAHLPDLAPASWVLQTLAVFFLVGGYSAGGADGRPRRVVSRAGAWVWRWLGRLARPVAALLAVTATALTDEAVWVAARVAWLPVFALALGVCLAAFRQLEHCPPGACGAGPVTSGGRAGPAPRVSHRWVDVAAGHAALLFAAALHAAGLLLQAPSLVGVVRPGGGLRQVA